MTSKKQKVIVEKRKTIAEYLVFIQAKGIEIGYFKLKPIKDLGCCSEAITEVINFDDAQKEVVRDEELITPKSCDCLKILPEKNCIDLIEIKGLIELFNRFNEADIWEKMIDDKIKGFDLQKKIEDSLHLLDTIVRKKEFGRTIEDAHFFRNIQINYILLTDIESKKQAFEDIASNFIFYGLEQYPNSMADYATNKFNAELSSIPNINHKLNRPMLKTCSEIDAYYAQ